MINEEERTTVIFTDHCLLKILVLTVLFDEMGFRSDVERNIMDSPACFELVHLFKVNRVFIKFKSIKNVSPFKYHERILILRLYFL